MWLPETETRFLRLALRDGPARAYGLAELRIEDLAFGASMNAFFQALAREAPRGTYPRGMSGEQSAWTLVGIDGGQESGLLSEDGALEVARGGFSIEPFVVADSRERRDGRFIERLGFYNPMAAGSEQPLRLALDRMGYWTGVGAKPSPAVSRLLEQAKTAVAPAAA